MGILDAAFQKKRGLKIEEKAKSPWIYLKLRNFSASIDAGNSSLKRAWGLPVVPGRVSGTLTQI